MVTCQNASGHMSKCQWSHVKMPVVTCQNASVIQMVTCQNASVIQMVTCQQPMKIKKVLLEYTIL